ncbi:MAG: rhomboid family intramembrane serine protease [Gemmatimonadota bacterium]|jgi:membrane associated rhomboid family serine protease|nr:rhomboid family intramembrane serine protease [Gemmatimonadota bacterium]
MTPWVQRLIIANIAVFGLQVLVPGVAGFLVFVPSEVLTRPWTILSYMFLHGGFSHLFFNMLGLFFFGGRVEHRLGGRDFARLYFVSGVAGALLSLVLAPRAAIIGASGGVFGVSLAFAMFWPRERIYIWGVLPVEAWLLVAINTGLSVFSGFGGSGSGVAHFAHLGGYLGAWAYLSLRERLSAGRRFQRQVRQVPAAADRAVRASLDRLQLDGVHSLTRAEVDRILDKISAEGMGSLTAQERLFLTNFVPPDDRRSWTA